MGKTHVNAGLAIFFLATAVMLIGGLALVPPIQQAQATAQPDMVTICHRNPSNPDNPVTITVIESAVQEHLDHGDSLGPCVVEEPPEPLAASITATPTQGDAPLTVQFQASATGGTPPYTYSWDFDGDGVVDETSDEPTAQHTYNEPGRYLVSLLVTDSASGEDQTARDTLEITVNEPRCFGETATRTGTAGNDNLVGTNGRDVIIGLGGDDTIQGLGGADLLCGNGDNDRIDGGSGNDRIDGGDGNDNNLSGSSGNDQIVGEAGNDNISGGSGNDNLGGGTGNDRLDGSSGIDRADGGPDFDTCNAETETNCEA
jgi:PKD repeat protein